MNSMIFTWYWVISDCEGCVGYLRVYHRLGHILPLNLHGEIAASKNCAKKYKLDNLSSVSKYLPWWEKERAEMNIKVIRDHIVHYSWLDCFKNCYLLSHHVHFSCEVFTLSRLTGNWALWAHSPVSAALARLGHLREYEWNTQNTGTLWPSAP